MHAAATGAPTARRLAAASGQLKPRGEPAAKASNGSSVQQARAPGSLSGESSLPSLVLGSANASSSNTRQTAFYSARSYFVVDASSEALSFHTADTGHRIDVAGGDSARRMARGTPPEQGATAEAAADEAFAHAIAKQYVLDAEAAGSYVPSHRSRVNTGASALAVGSDRLTTSASEETAPQLPGLHFMGQDYESSVSVEKLSTASLSQLQQQQQQQQQRRAYEYSLSEKDSEPRGESEERAMSQRLRDEEVEDDANEASHFVSARMRYPAPQYTVRADGSLPLGAVLFAGGFLLLPLWWLGVLLPRKCDTDVARTWRKYNALMSLLSLPLLALFLALGGWQATHG